MASTYTRPIGYGTVNFALNISAVAKPKLRQLADQRSQSLNKFFQEMVVRGVAVDSPEDAAELRRLLSERKSMTPELGRIVSRHIARVGGSVAALIILVAMMIAGDDHDMRRARRGRSGGRTTASRNFKTGRGKAEIV